MGLVMGCSWIWKWIRATDLALVYTVFVINVYEGLWGSVVALRRLHGIFLGTKA